MVLKKRMVTSHLTEADLENVVTKFFVCVSCHETRFNFKYLKKKCVVEDKICYVGFSPIGK